MGGWGSGTWNRPNPKATVDEFWRLNIEQLVRDRLLTPWTSGTIAWHVNNERRAAVGYTVRPAADDGLLLTLNYCLRTGEVELPIRLEVTRPHFGGRRWWFRCPLGVRGRPCGRRVGRLYLRGKFFGCRQCHDLTYTSCQDAHKFERALAAIGVNFGLSGRETERLLKRRFAGKPV